MPIGKEYIGASVVGRQAAGRITSGDVAFVVQHFRRRHVDVLPAGLL
jgi:hypothetical protein